VFLSAIGKEIHVRLRRRTALLMCTAYGRTTDAKAFLQEVDVAPPLPEPTTASDCKNLQAQLHMLTENMTSGSPCLDLGHRLQAVTNPVSLATLAVAAVGDLRSAQLNKYSTRSLLEKCRDLTKRALDACVEAHESDYAAVCNTISRMLRAISCTEDPLACDPLLPRMGDKVTLVHFKTGARLTTTAEHSKTNSVVAGNKQIIVSREPFLEDKPEVQWKLQSMGVDGEDQELHCPKLRDGMRVQLLEVTTDDATTDDATTDAVLEVHIADEDKPKHSTTNKEANTKCRSAFLLLGADPPGCWYIQHEHTKNVLSVTELRHDLQVNVPVSVRDGTHRFHVDAAWTIRADRESVLRRLRAACDKACDKACRTFPLNAPVSHLPDIDLALQDANTVALGQHYLRQREYGKVIAILHDCPTTVEDAIFARNLSPWWSCVDIIRGLSTLAAAYHLTSRATVHAKSQDMSLAHKHFTTAIRKLRELSGKEWWLGAMSIYHCVRLTGTRSAQIIFDTLDHITFGKSLWLRNCDGGLLVLPHAPSDSTDDAYSKVPLNVAALVADDDVQGDQRWQFHRCDGTANENNKVCSGDTVWLYHEQLNVYLDFTLSPVPAHAEHEQRGRWRVNIHPERLRIDLQSCQAETLNEKQSSWWVEMADAPGSSYQSTIQSQLLGVITKLYDSKRPGVVDRKFSQASGGKKKSTNQECRTAAQLAEKQSVNVQVLLAAHGSEGVPHRQFTQIYKTRFQQPFEVDNHKAIEVLKHVPNVIIDEKGTNLTFKNMDKLSLLIQ